ncbi:hypothetical protein D3261_03140 [Halococcus sp. IIIV-5B]|nr:hypothetical protein D3261_03140 [Halococcus sp. IIIV-5B]
MNNQNTPHQVTLSITTIPDEGGGFSNYFTGTWLVTSNSEHTFEKELMFTDFEPELMALVVLDDGTRTRTDFTFSLDLTALRIIIADEDIHVQPRK